MPIYPDEVAFRMSSSRFIQDSMMVNGLFANCVDNIKSTPSLFYIPAFIISWVNIQFSAVQLRYFSFILIIAFFLIILRKVNNQSNNSLGSFFALTGLVGVSGSGLILLRAEILQLFNIFFCIVAFFYLTNKSRTLLSDYLLSIILLITSLTSAYAHPQGILFMPLTLFFILKIFEKKIPIKWLVIILLTFLLYSLKIHFSFINFSCRNFIPIENFLSSMTFDFSQFKETPFIIWIAQKIYRFIHPFLYKSSFAINYLPGIIYNSILEKILFNLENFFISIILLVNLSIPFLFFKRMIGKNINVFNPRFLNNTNYIAPLLFLLPIFFLLIYDQAQNFYRQFFLNFLLAIFAAFYLRNVKKNIYTKMYTYLVCATICISILINYHYFFGPLKKGIAGPSISLIEYQKDSSNDISSLAKLCNIDLKMGNGVVDDFTYEYVKESPSLYPYTYLLVAANVSGLKINQIFDEIKPSFALARCGNFTYGSNPFPYDNQLNGLCCSNFNKLYPKK